MGGWGCWTGLGVDLAQGNLIVVALVGELSLGPCPRDDFQGLVHHSGSVFQVCTESGHLVGVAGAAYAQVNPSLAENVQGGGAGRDVERVLHRGHHHGDAQTHPDGALAQCAKGYVGGAGVGPLGTELVVGHPDAGQAHLFSIGHLVKHFQEPVSLVGAG